MVMVKLIAGNVYSGLAKALCECLMEVTLFNFHLTSFVAILCRSWSVYPHETDEKTEVEKQGNLFSTTEQVCGRAVMGTWLSFIPEPIHLTILYCSCNNSLELSIDKPI